VNSTSKLVTGSAVFGLGGVLLGYLGVLSASHNWGATLIVGSLFSAALISLALVLFSKVQRISIASVILSLISGVGAAHVGLLALTIVT
jgi:hypothetical protein